MKITRTCLDPLKGGIAVTALDLEFGYFQGARPARAHNATRAGPTPPGEDSFACVNLWMLDKALAYGSRKISFICLWDRQAGDGPGGTKHLHDAVVQGSGKAYVLDTTKLW